MYDDVNDIYQNHPQMKNSLVVILLGIFILPVSLESIAQNTLLSEGKPEEVGLSSDHLKNIDQLFNKWIDDNKIPGGIVLVARKGKIAYFKSFGKSDIEEGKEYQNDDIFRMASMTKGVTTTAVLQLYEQGLFGMDDPISQYIPSFENTAVLDEFNESDSSYTTKKIQKQITIRHLLSHTSGIPYAFSDKKAAAIFAKNDFVNFGLSHDKATTKEMVEMIAQQPLLHQPGEKWTYGHNTDVLGYFIEVISGKTLGEYCRVNIFEPIGMNDTYFYLPKNKHSRLVPVYSELGNGKIVKRPWKTTNYPTYGRDDHFAGGGGLSSTAMDYAIFCQMLLNNGSYNGRRILSRKTIDLMNSDQLEKMGIDSKSSFGNKGTSFGLGFALNTQQSTSHSHGSEGAFNWGGIFNTKYWIDPKEEMFMVAMAQIYPFSGGDIWTKLQTIIYSSIED